VLKVFYGNIIDRVRHQDITSLYKQIDSNLVHNKRQISLLFWTLSKTIFWLTIISIFIVAHYRQRGRDAGQWKIWIFKLWGETSPLCE